MAKVGYDGFAGISRIADAEATIDQRAAVILTFHAALEREVDVVLAALLPRPEKIRKGFGFANKNDVLAAVWKGAPDAGDILHTVLRRFTELRNKVAHGHPIEEVDRHLELLLDAYRAIDPKVDVHVGIAEVAQGICSFMSDGPTITEFSAMLKSLDHLVNVAAPRSLGTLPSPAGQTDLDQPSV